MDEERINPIDNMPQWKVNFPSVQFEATTMEEAELTIQDMLETGELLPSISLTEIN